MANFPDRSSEQTRWLITGGAGFIGSHLADTLVGRGNELVLLDDLSTGSVDNIVHLHGNPLVQTVNGSILDEELIRSLVPTVDVVVHLAASVGVRRIIDRPLESLLNNVKGTEIVLEACARHHRKVLIASTSEIYGKNMSDALDEDADRILGSPFKARWSYSTSKAVDEILAHAYWRTRGTPTIVVRLFNCVGPRQTGEYGMVVPRLVCQALQGDPLTVYGDGSQRRSFCHVYDTVRALTALLDHQDAVGDVYNVGAPREVTIDQLAEMILLMSGSDSQITHIPYDEVYAHDEGFEDMARRFPDISRIRSLTGWVPQHSLEDIVRDVLTFEGDRMDALSRVAGGGPAAGEPD
jgi:UDP-glucose 4-epimerase